MVPCAFDQENRIYNPPPGMGECESITAYDGKDALGNNVVITCWKLTKEEVDELIRTGRLWLIVSGRGMPPVALTGISPWEPK